MDGMTGPGGVPAWLDEQLGREELPNQVKQLGRLKRLRQQVSVRQDQPATDKILGSGKGPGAPDAVAIGPHRDFLRVAGCAPLTGHDSADPVRPYPCESHDWRPHPSRFNR